MVHLLKIFLHRIKTKIIELVEICIRCCFFFLIYFYEISHWTTSSFTFAKSGLLRVTNKKLFKTSSAFGKASNKPLS